MIDIKCLVIDNVQFQIAAVRNELNRIGIAAENIWPNDETPETEATFHDWGTVFGRLTATGRNGWDPRSHCVVAFLDLALDDQDHAWDVGMLRIREQFNNLLRNYVVVVLSQFGMQARNELRDSCDAVLDRTKLRSTKAEGPKEAIESTLRDAIASWERRLNRKAPALGRSLSNVFLNDSPALRRLEAAIGAETIRHISSIVAQTSDRIDVSAASGGYSGAFVVKLDWASIDGNRSVVLKLAKDRRLLEDEVDAWRKMATAYEAFVGLIPPLVDPAPHECRTDIDAVWYVVQSRVPGPTFEEAILEKVLEETNQTGRVGLINSVFQSIEKMTRSSMRLSLSIQRAPKGIMLHEDDVARFRASVDSLCSVSELCMRFGYLPNTSEFKAKVEAFLANVVMRWNDALVDARINEMPVCNQHGDLNARNIILPQDGHPQLIDFARFGQWPVFYDLVRLELQLSFRILDTDDVSDAFPNHLTRWLSVHGCRFVARNQIDDDGDSWCSGETFLALRSRILECEKGLHDEFQNQLSGFPVEKLVGLSRTYDAIKMCSYQDASWFKRVLYLIIAMESAEDAGLMPR